MAVSSKLIAVIAVIVVVAAACAVVVMNGDDNNGGDSPAVASEYGLVYGNADGNCLLDDSDLDIIKSNIGKAVAETDYPFADADRDGQITQADYDMVQRMINKESMTVWVKDESGADAVACNYPIIKAFVSGGANMRTAISVLDLTKIMTANAAGSAEKMTATMDGKLMELRDSGTITVISSKATSDDQTKLADTDFQVAIIEESGMEYYASQSFRDLYASKGASLIQFTFDSYTSSLRGMATLGILVGSEAQAGEYIEFLTGIVDTIKKNEGDKYGSATVMDVVMTNSVNGTSGDYYQMTILAGGNNLADFEASTKKFPDGSDNTWLLDPKYNPQYLIHYSSTSYNEAPAAKTLKAIAENFKETAAYKAEEYYVINGVLPLPVRLALTAQIMYSDCFDADWSQSLLEQYMNEFLGYKDYDASGDKYMWTTQDIKALIA